MNWILIYWEFCYYSLKCPTKNIKITVWSSPLTNEGRQPPPHSFRTSFHLFAADLLRKKNLQSFCFSSLILKYYANVKDTIDRLPCLNYRISAVLSRIWRLQMEDHSQKTVWERFRSPMVTRTAAKFRSCAGEVAFPRSFN